MGSSSLSDGPWIVLAALCGVLYLIFDAARHFEQQISAVTLRRWTGDSDFAHGSRWFQFDPRNLQLVSGTVLQMSLVFAFASTVMALGSRSPAVDVGLAALIWVIIGIAWKFLLAFVPDELGEKILRGLLPFSHFFYYLFWPALFPLRRLLDRIDQRQEENAGDDDEPTEEEVQAFIDVGEEEGILEGTEGQLVQSIVDFGDRVARELMTPRIDVLAFDAKRSLNELAQVLSESKYSRIPIYTESIDSITGVVHIKEVFDAIMRKHEEAVSDLARGPYFVSETKKVSELLREFQSEHLQIAIVVDEYGGTAGIITIEDIIEDIVGEISDEHEDVEATVVDLGDDQFLVSGLLRVETLEEMIDADLSSEDYETVAGLIFTTLGRIPKVGARVTKNGWRLDVDRADRRRIYRVKVSRDPEWKADEEEA